LHIVLERGFGMGRAVDITKRVLIGWGHYTLKVMGGIVKLIGEEIAHSQDRRRAAEAERQHLRRIAMEARAQGYGWASGTSDAWQGHGRPTIYRPKPITSVPEPRQPTFEDLINSNPFTGKTPFKPPDLDNNAFTGKPQRKKRY
jgi:hypothetical protein